MADEFLTDNEAAAAPAPAKQRKRGPMPEAQKQKIRVSHARRGKLPEPEKEIQSQIPNVKTGMTDDERLVMDLTRKLAEAKAKIQLQAISESERDMIRKEVAVDIFTKRRYFVELTPSMCDVANCSYDAATDPSVGCAGWDAAPIDQVLDNGKTFGQKLIELKEFHKAASHTQEALNSHIISAEELRKRQWGVGGAAKSDFLT